MFRILKIFLLLLALMPLSFSLEYFFSEFGFSGLSANFENPTSCSRIDFQLDSLEQINLVPVISIYLKSSNFVGDSFVTYSLNNSLNGILWPENFICKGENCIARIYLKKNDLSKLNNLNLCINFRGISNEIVILPESRIGFYDTPAFTIEAISPGKIFLGEKAQIVVNVENYGTKDANVFIQFIEEDLRSLIKITSFDIVEGDSTASALVRAGESKKFVYTIKPNLSSSYNLPYTALYFTNSFGEKFSIKSNHPQLIVSDEKKIELVLIVDSINPDNTVDFKVVVRNKRFSTYTAFLKVFPQEKIPNSLIRISIPPNSEKEFSFKSIQLPPGRTIFSASVIDFNSVNIDSDVVEVSIIEPSIPPIVYYALFSILISLGLFVLIYFYWKEK